RTESKDTVQVALEDVLRITKIMVTVVPEDSVIQKQPPKPAGRFNNKVNVYQFGYQFIQTTDHEDLIIKGIHFSYFRNIQNRYFPGFSLSFAKRKYEYDLNNLYSHEYAEYKQLHLLLENKIRLFEKIQKTPFCILAALNFGITRDRSVIKYDLLSTYNNGKTFEYQNCFTAQTLMGLKVNPDKNSGFIFEPGVIWQRTRQKVINQFNSSSQKITSWSILPTLRLNYFF
ncbi:MAG: hypothetical protein ACRC3B_02550, partial [Bacteroidia bacterium]